MKIYFSIIIASLIFLVPFFCGFFEGRKTHSTIVEYQDKEDLTEEEIKVVTKTNQTIKEMENVVKKWEREKVEIKKEHKEEKANEILTLSIFTYNSRRAIIGIISMGVMFIPIGFETGRIVGYYMANITFNWIVLFTLESSSYIVFCSSVYYFLSNLFVSKKYKRTLIIFSLMVIIAVLLLLLSAYFEAFY